MSAVLGAIGSVLSWLSHAPRAVDLGLAVVVAIVFWWIPSPAVRSEDLKCQ